MTNLLLNEHSHQFRDLKGRFLSFWPEFTQSFLNVLTIEAISNPERQFCFNIVEGDHLARWGRLLPDKRPECNTIELLHGSSHNNLRSIAAHGFNLESDPANGAIYGTGAYLTPKRRL